MINAFSRHTKSIPDVAQKAVSPQTALVLDSDEIRMLTEIGFLATGNGYVDHALRIFNALRLVRPQRAFPVIGLAITLMNARKTEQAVQLLESVSLSCPSEQLQRNVWLGFALQQSDHQNAGRQLLQSVLTQTDSAEINTDTQHVALAQALLDQNATSMATPGTSGMLASDHRESS